jgi:hypothetical protein
MPLQKKKKPSIQSKACHKQRDLDKFDKTAYCCSSYVLFVPLHRSKPKEKFVKTCSDECTTNNGYSTEQNTMNSTVFTNLAPIRFHTADIGVRCLMQRPDSLIKISIVPLFRHSTNAEKSICTVLFTFSDCPPNEGMP